ncbi:MlaE family ABC transporter permease [Gilvimarinus sp. F26214L]|uniref:MlaE family ABC transporter permease n=1 Tax=Gilvimarinus sp. DZF01 TaxID=3461371 RepID=UPI0040463977
MSGAGRVVHVKGVWQIEGDWTLPFYEELRREVERVESRLRTDDVISLSSLGRLDTAGAGVLCSLLGSRRIGELQGAPHGRRHAPDDRNEPAPEPHALTPEKIALLSAVAKALEQPESPEVEQPSGIAAELAHIGRTIETVWSQQRTLLGFMGLTLQTLVTTIPKPGRWRLTALAAQIENTGLDALPIVALLTFLVGAVVAFLGATVLAEFGASVFTVNLVAFSFLREFGVLLAAILLAGRTGSAFAAQIGSMKANQEVDAIRVLGLDPVELLVLPRVLGLIVTLPILTLVGMVSGIAGGLAVSALALDITPLMYVSILQSDISVSHFWVGLSKAPVFAFVIAVIGCVEGFKVSGSAQSVGEHTTSSVVQSIFMVILLDAIAALFFMQMDL